MNKMGLWSVLNMLRRSYSLAAVVTILLASFTTHVSAGQTVHSSFAPSSEPIANPERGFYRYSATYSASYNGLNEQELVRYRKSSGVTLLFRYFFLEDFTDRPISDEYLRNVEDDFDTIRKAGLKCIVRFAYTDEVRGDFEPPYGDAPKERVLQHIRQLTPILQQNSDVIAVVQAGFIGIWGEWYYTDHFANPNNPSDISPEQYADREEVLLALLDAVGEERKVQVRYVPMKAKLLNLPEGLVGALSAEEAHKPTAKARVGFHNDCFLASRTDYGTYRWDRVEEDKEYLAQDGRFLPIGGETCHPNPPRSSCATALEELERLHWSYLNTEYHPEVLSSWQQDGCMDEVKERLGYRFTLREAEVTRVVPAGATLDLAIRLANTGWAAPFNRRDVRVLLRSEDKEVEYATALSSDPRFWMPGQDVALEVSIELPADFPEGTYDVLLHLPDPDPRLASRPEYAIRFANDGIWEPKTGYNDLQLDVRIEGKTLRMEPGAFEARTDGDAVLLRWRTASETNNAGFEVQLNRGPSAGAFVRHGFVASHGTTTEAQQYSYRVEDLEPGRYTFRLKQLDSDGAFVYGPEVETLIETAEPYGLSAPYPDPLKGQARFTLTVRKAQHVTISVYNTMGQCVALLHEGVLEANKTERFVLNVHPFPSGVYFIRVRGERFEETRQIVVLK